MGHSYHQWKLEYSYGTIIFAYFIAPKSYQIILLLADGTIEVITKVKGFCWSSKHSQDLLKNGLFKTFTQAFQVNEFQETSVGQFSIRTEKKSRQLYSIIIRKQFTNNNFTKRVAIKNGKSPMTLPYGFTNEMKIKYTL